MAPSASPESLFENHDVINANSGLTREIKRALMTAPFQIQQTLSTGFAAYRTTFPQLSVTKPGSPPPGSYLTGNLTTAWGAGTFAIVLDANGTPVWYRRTATVGALDVTRLSDHSIAWMAFTGPFGTDLKGAFEVYDLRTRSTSWLAAPTPPTDCHELHLMSNGDLMLLSTPLTPNVDASAFGGSSSSTVVDCMLRSWIRKATWSGNGARPITSAAESTHPSLYVVGQQPAYDIFHCNSIDTDPISGNVVLFQSQYRCHLPH